jgi:hypothetical protein
MVAWAYAKAGDSLPELLDALAAAATHTIGSFNGQELANTAWAFATLRQRELALFDAIAAAAAPKIGPGFDEFLLEADEFNAQELSNTLWAFAKLGLAAPRLFEAAAAAICERWRGAASVKQLGWGEQDLCNTLWAFAQADVHHDELMRACEASLASGGWVLAPGHLTQIQQWLVWRETERRATPSVPLPPELAAACRGALATAEVKISRMQRSVACALRRLRPDVAFEEEAVDPASGYSIDIAASDWDRTAQATGTAAGYVLVSSRRAARLAVEVDGPHHFAHDGAPTGATLLKRRQLRALGWALVSVSGDEWNRVSSDAAAECALLEGKLREASAHGS